MAITQESFDTLLSWLDPNRDTAGQKYETIHSGLIRIFISQGFIDAEDLADLTINRVIDRLPDIREGYIGEPVRYFHGVARNIIREARRRPEIATALLPEDLTPKGSASDEHECLLHCLDLSPQEKRELILEYYLYEGREKIEHHKSMAQEYSITVGALRSRAHHIRDGLENCVLNCIKNFREKRKASEKALLKRQ